MSYTKNFPGDGGIQLAIVGGGDITDPQESQSCGQKIWSPLEHQDGEVKLDDLAFSPMMHSPTGFSQQSFHGAMDPGSLVYVMKTLGQNQVQILGQANDLLNFGGGQSGAMGGQGGGGKSLMNGSTVQELMNREIKILVPPQIKEGESRGAKVRLIKEKGKQHKHALLNGLPSHGALFDISGWKIPQITDVPTAKQHYQDIQSNDLMSMLPGELSSLGGMMQGLLSSLGSTKGAGGGKGMGGGASAGGGSGGYKTKTDYTLVDNVPNAKVVINGNTSSDIVSVPNTSITSTSTGSSNANSRSTNLEASVSFLGDNTAFTTNSSTNNFNPDSTVKSNTSTLVEKSGSTTTATTTEVKTTTTVEDGEYDTNYLSGDLKLGKAILRYTARKFDKELKPRVNITVAKTVTQEQVNNSTQEASNNYSQTSTTTTEKTETLRTSVQNFEGTYTEYYGADSEITRMDIIMNTVKPEIQDAINSISLLIQGMESGGTGSFMTANRVHLETYLDNACDLFCQVTSVTDLMNTLKRLQHDESLFGLDKLEQIQVAQNTAWGTANTYVAANGDLITIFSEAQLKQQADELADMLSSIASPSVTGMANANATESANTANANNRIVSTTVPSPGQGGFKPSQNPGGGGSGGGKGGNMFGKHAETLMDMLKRMPSEHQKDAKNLHKNLNQGPDHTKLWKIVEKTLQGGNPIDVNLFK